MKISRFINENIPLCICTLGLAIIGYMGYRAILWIKKKCEKIQKIDEISKERLESVGLDHKSERKQRIDGKESPKPMHQPLATSPSLLNRVSKVDIPEGEINIGQGEYIVFHKLPNGEKREVARETYEQVYKILNEYAPASIMSRNSDSSMEECENRYEIIKSRVKEIDPTLEVVFVPRTLYELIFIRKCIQEDLKHNKICDQLYTGTLNKYAKEIKRIGDNQEELESFENERLKKIAKEKKCWHLCYFENVGDNHHPGVRDVAYRLNCVIAKILKTLLLTTEGFTHDQFSSLAEREIEFLKAYFREKGQGIINCNYTSPSNNFACESERGQIKGMPISEENHEQLIRNAIAIDCSRVAAKAFILYRGANYVRDNILQQGTLHSLSFGTGLFAGCLYDAGATAFYYMRRKEDDAYAIPVPFDQINRSPFFIPPTNTIAQLYGKGEIFHGRTKAWKFHGSEKEITGIYGYKFTPDYLKTEHSKETLLEQFKYYKNQAIQLKERNHVH